MVYYKLIEFILNYLYIKINIFGIGGVFVFGVEISIIPHLCDSIH
jgi:hypothetical protein